MARKPTRPWKKDVQANRRAAAEERQKKYDSLPLTEKIKRAGDKQKAKLLLKTNENRS